MPDRQDLYKRIISMTKTGKLVWMRLDNIKYSGVDRSGNRYLLSESSLSFIPCGKDCKYALPLVSDLFYDIEMLFQLKDEGYVDCSEKDVLDKFFDMVSQPESDPDCVFDKVFFF